MKNNNSQINLRKSFFKMKKGSAHHVWLIAGIAIAVLAVFFLVFYSRFTPLAGQAYTAPGLVGSAGLVVDCDSTTGVLDGNNCTATDYKNEFADIIPATTPTTIEEKAEFAADMAIMVKRMFT